MHHLHQAQLHRSQSQKATTEQGWPYLNSSPQSLGFQAKNFEAKWLDSVSILTRTIPSTQHHSAWYLWVRFPIHRQANTTRPPEVIATFDRWEYVTASDITLLKLNSLCQALGVLTTSLRSPTKSWPCATYLALLWHVRLLCFGTLMPIFQSQITFSVTVYWYPSLAVRYLHIT